MPRFPKAYPLSSDPYSAFGAAWAARRLANSLTLCDDHRCLLRGRQRQILMATDRGLGRGELTLMLALRHPGSYAVGRRGSPERTAFASYRVSS